MNTIPQVLQVVSGKNFTIYAYFDDGTVRLADIKPLLSKGGVFEALRDVHNFEKCLTVMNGTVAWDIAGNRDESTCIDLDPCEIYETSTIVSDPLERHVS